MEELAKRARESLSNYCYTECLAHCCRYGYLLLTKKETEMFGSSLKMVPTSADGREYVFDLKLGCPNLVDYKCTIHTNILRPKACREFPVFLWKNNTVMVSNKCPAVKDNKLYPFIAEFKRRGAVIVYGE